MGLTKNETAPATQAPTPYETGHKGTLVDFIQADGAAKIQFLSAQAACRAQMKKPSRFNQAVLGTQADKNAELEEKIQSAAHAAEKIRRPLREGARQAFLDGNHEKIQILLSEPEKFITTGLASYDPAETQNKFVADILINLINDSADPDAVLPLALERVDEEKRLPLLSNALHELVSKHWDKDFEKVASILLEAGAEPSSAGLADAIHRKLPYVVVTMLLDQGASLDEASVILTKRKSDSLDKLEFIERDCTQRAIINGMAENIRDLTGVTEGRHRQPETSPDQPAAKHRKPAAQP